MLLDGLALQLERWRQLTILNGEHCRQNADGLDLFPLRKRLHQAIDVLLDARSDAGVVSDALHSGERVVLALAPFFDGVGTRHH